MNPVDLLFPLAVIAIYLSIAIPAYRRQGRNAVLEGMIGCSEVAPLAAYRGTLAITDLKPGSFLRLRKDSDAGRLQFKYRWITGVGPQAIFDEIIFDNSQRAVELVRNTQRRSRAFAEFSAIRLRESSGEHGSIWHLELIPQRGKTLLFLTSERQERRAGFERTGVVAKAVAAISCVPVQVVVDGNAWTPGWPPKSYMAFSGTSPS
jgi:hypothetical protein